MAPEPPAAPPAPALPSAAYVSPAYFAHEVSWLFRREWMAVCRSEQIVSPSDYRAVEVADQCVLVRRGDDGALIAAAALPDGAPDAPGPDVSGGPDAIGVAEWGGFVFLNLTADQDESLSTLVVGVSECAARQPLEGLRITRRLAYHVEANWKLICEHLSTWEQAGTPAPRRSELIYPSLCLNLEHDHVVAFILHPAGTCSTRVECLMLFPGETIEDDRVDFTSAAERQDCANQRLWSRCEQAHEAIESRAEARGGRAREVNAGLNLLHLLQEELALS